MRKVVLGLACGLVLAAVPAIASESPGRLFEPVTIGGSSGASLDSISLSPDGKLYVLGSKGSAAAMWRLDAAHSELAPSGLLANLPAGAPAGLTVDSAGYPHVAQNNPVGTVVRRSIDEGTTWDRGTPLATPGSTASLASTRFNSIVEGSTLFATTVVRDNGFLSRSDDGGLTWTDHQPLFLRCDACADSLSDVVVSPEGDVHVAYIDADGNLVVQYSRDGDGTIERTDTSFEQADYTGRPSLSTGDDGDLFVAFTQNDGSMSVRQMNTREQIDPEVVPVISGTVHSPRVAYGDGSISLAWLELNDGVWSLMFTTGPNIFDLETPSVVEAVAASGVDPVPDLEMTVDSSNNYRIVYERITVTGSELRLLSLTP